MIKMISTVILWQYQLLSFLKLEKITITRTVQVSQGKYIADYTKNCCIAVRRPSSSVTHEPMATVADPAASENVHDNISFIIIVNFILCQNYSLMQD